MLDSGEQYICIHVLNKAHDAYCPAGVDITPVILSDLWLLHIPGTAVYFTSSCTSVDILHL